ALPISPRPERSSPPWTEATSQRFAPRARRRWRPKRWRTRELRCWASWEPGSRRAHIQALTRVRKIECIRLYSPSGTSAAAIKKEMATQLNCPIEVCENAESAVRGADILVTVTTAKEPIVKPQWLKPGMHINAVGSHRPDLREIDGATLGRAKIVVDSREAIMAECGDILLALKEKSIGENAIHAEIGEVLAEPNQGARTADEITLYK